MSGEMVNNPAHYNQGGIECIDAMEAAVAGKHPVEALLVSNVVRYLWRYEAKGGLQDVQKARWYIDRLIARLEDQKAASERVAADAAGWTDAAIKAAALPTDPLMCDGCLSGCWVCQPGAAPKTDLYSGKGGVMLDLEHPGVSGW